MALAQFLSTHPNVGPATLHIIAQSHPALLQVEQVLYPGLPSHKNHDVAKREMRMYGACIVSR